MNTDTELKIGKYKVKILRDACIGAASCVALSPSVFALDGESKAVFVDQPNDSDENILSAAQACPTQAIVITDAETGEQVYPR